LQVAGAFWIVSGIAMSSHNRAQSTSVCFISPKSYPLFNEAVESVFGGAEVDAYLLATELAKDACFAVSVIVADYGQPDEEVRNGVRIIKGLDFRISAPANALRLWRAMRRSEAEVFFLETASPGVPFTALYCRLRRRQWVYRTASRLESDGTYLRQHRILGRLFLASLRRAGAVMVQNESDRRQLTALAGVTAEVVPNAQRIPLLVPEDKAGPVLWVGRSERVKRPDLFLALARRLPDEQFMMVCQRATGESRYEELKREAAAVSNLSFVERVPFHQIDAYFQRAKVLVNTSDSEGFPNAFIQACKNGTAILSLNTDPDGFLVRHGCGVFCEGDFERLVLSLKQVLADGSWLEMGRRGRQYAVQNHDLAGIIERYKAHFARLAER
jgi:glycosyltransferase involved in cell wall biosynthesis